MRADASFSSYSSRLVASLGLQIGMGLRMKHLGLQGLVMETVKNRFPVRAIVSLWQCNEYFGVANPWGAMSNLHECFVGFGVSMPVWQRHFLLSLIFAYFEPKMIWGMKMSGRLVC